MSLDAYLLACLAALALVAHVAEPLLTATATCPTCARAMSIAGRG